VFKQRCRAMLDEGAKDLARDGFEPARQAHNFTLDMRYAGQSYTLTIGCDPATATWDDLRAAFGARHKQTFGYADAENDAEIVNIRLVSLGLIDKPTLEFAPEGKGDPLIERRPVWFGDGWTDCPVFDRAKLQIGDVLTGPMILEEAGGTSVVPPGWRITVLASGTLDCRAGAVG